MLVSPARLPLAVVGALLVAGCALSPKEDPSQFYVLASPAEQAPAADGDMILGLGPVTVPEYLRRPQMVTRQSENQVSLSEAHRWAEDLEAGFARVLKEELQRASGAARVRVFPWPLGQRIDYVVEVDVTRFEGTAGGTIQLWAIWRVVDGESRVVVARHESRLSEPATGSEANAVVAAQSRSIGQLGRAIAAGLQELGP